MSKQTYFSTYKSPNICIVPSASMYPPSPKRPKLDLPNRADSPQYIDVSFLDDFDIDEIIKCLNDTDDALNTSDIENIDILERDCHKNNLKIASEVKYINGEREIIDNLEIDIVKNTNTFIEKEINRSSTYNDNKCSNKDASEMIEFSSSTKQPNNKMCNGVAIEITQNIITSCENETENNIQERVKEKTFDILLQGEQDLASINKITIKHKNFDDNGNTDIISNKIMKSIDKIDNNKRKYQQHDIERRDTTILDNEREMEKIYTNGMREYKHLHNCDVENSEVENLEILDKNIINIKKNQDLSPKNEKQKDMFMCSLENRMNILLNKKYSMFSFVYSGRYSDIYKCKDAKGDLCAVKVLKKYCTGYQQDVLLNRIRGDIPKDNLLCIYLINGFTINKNWCYLTDFYTKNLKDLLKNTKKNLYIDTIQVLAGQLLGAITTLRNKNIVHSDIKPGHILLDDTNSKLRVCGFDRAYDISSSNLFPYKGTKCYRAPEVILGYSSGFSLDVWSTALVLHEMATGIQIFGGCVDDLVLYKQMCLLGDVPPDMLLKSQYGHKYNIGFCFQDKCWRHKKNSNVKVKNKMACTVHGAYYTHWAPGRSRTQISNDMKKIGQFIGLLGKMLVMSPELRLPIEFAYTNPFIYKVFDR